MRSFPKIRSLRKSSRREPLDGNAAETLISSPRVKTVLKSCALSDLGMAYVGSTKLMTDAIPIQSACRYVCDLFAFSSWPGVSLVIRSITQNH
jgi:hypothetical protein